MKRGLFIIAALAGILSTEAQAHIGWDLNDCIGRYGKEIKESKNTNSGEIHYFYVATSNLSLSVIMRNDKVKAIIYRKTGVTFSSDEVDILQQLNQKEMLGCEGIKWTVDVDIDGLKVWSLHRDGNGQLQALLSDDKLNGQKFEIRTYDQINVETNAIRQDKLDQLKGM